MLYGIRGIVSALQSRVCEQALFVHTVQVYLCSTLLLKSPGETAALPTPLSSAPPIAEWPSRRLCPIVKGAASMPVLIFEICPGTNHVRCPLRISFRLVLTKVIGETVRTAASARGLPLWRRHKELPLGSARLTFYQGFAHHNWH